MRELPDRLHFLLRRGAGAGLFPRAHGRNIYTSLSHDVIVRETTHALIDAPRERYSDPSGSDQAAFHEGFADIVARLSVFAQVELVVEILHQPTAKSRPQGYLRDQDLTAPALRRSTLFGLAG